MANIMTEKKSKKKIIIGAVIILIIASLFVSFLKWKQKPDPTSEKIICEIAGKQLNKDPNSLTDEDFAQITYFVIIMQELSDIRLLEKFTNLKELLLMNITFPVNKIPKWMKVLAKYRIINLEKRFAIDLSPLTNLDNLQTLTISSTRVADITPLANLKNLNILHLTDIQVSDIRPLANLTNLNWLLISHTQVSDIKPLANLTNLQTLYVLEEKVIDIKPLANLKKLNTLNISGTNASDEQIAELKKALPNTTFE